MCRSLKFVCKMVLIWFLCLCTWKTRLLCLKLCCFYNTKVEMVKFAGLMAKCLTNSLWKFHRKILNYSENEIFVGRGVFLAAPGRRPFVHFGREPTSVSRLLAPFAIHTLDRSYINPKPNPNSHNSPFITV